MDQNSTRVCVRYIWRCATGKEEWMQGFPGGRDNSTGELQGHGHRVKDPAKHGLVCFPVGTPFKNLFTDIGSLWPEKSPGLRGCKT
jgi:hypothetical protein